MSKAKASRGEDADVYGFAEGGEEDDLQEDGHEEAVGQEERGEEDERTATTAERPRTQYPVPLCGGVPDAWRRA